MKINWKVRIQNKMFWMTIIPAVLVAIKSIADVFGISIDVSVLSGKLVSVVEAIFVVLAIMGIVVDPTTKGASDSDRAMDYDKPQ